MSGASILGKAISAVPRSVLTMLAAGLIADTLFISWITKQTPGDLIGRVLVWADLPTVGLGRVRLWLTDRHEIVTALVIIVVVLTIAAVGACVSKGTYQLWDDFTWTGALCACALVYVDLAGTAALLEIAVLFLVACLIVAMLNRDLLAGAVMAIAPVMLALSPALFFVSWVSRGIDPDRRGQAEGTRHDIQVSLRPGAFHSSLCRAPLNSSQPVGGTSR